MYTTVYSTAQQSTCRVTNYPLTRVSGNLSQVHVQPLQYMEMELAKLPGTSRGHCMTCETLPGVPTCISRAVRQNLRGQTKPRGKQWQQIVFVPKLAEKKHRSAIQTATRQLLLCICSHKVSGLPWKLLLHANSPSCTSDIRCSQ